MRRAGSVLLLLVFCSVLVVKLPMPLAQGCSCAGIADVEEAIAQSEAAFVGTLIDKTDLGPGQFGGGESVHRFEVERWVKGDLGEVIDVRSPASSGACGLEFFDGERIGAFLRRVDDHLESSLCEQIDPDVLIAAVEGPVRSATAIPRLLVAQGWDSPELVLLDEQGGLIGELDPGPPSNDFEGTSGLSMCPAGELVVQWSTYRVNVWEVATWQVVASHDISALDGEAWISDVGCREPDAGSVLLIAGNDDGGALYETVPELSELRRLPDSMGLLGVSHVVVWSDMDRDYTRIDLNTGEEVLLYETRSDRNWGAELTPNPFNGTTAMVEVRFEEGGSPESTLFVLDETGETIDQVEIPHEAYSPVWLDRDRVLVTAYDYTGDDAEAIGYLLDLLGGEVVELPGWRGGHATARENTIYSVDGGDLLATDLTTLETRLLTTLPVQFAGPIVTLNQEGEVSVPVGSEPSSAAPTTPPLLPGDGLVVVGEGEPALEIPWDPADTAVQAIWWVALGVVLAAAIWAGRGSRRRDDSD